MYHVSDAADYIVPQSDDDNKRASVCLVSSFGVNFIGLLIEDENPHRFESLTVDSVCCMVATTSLVLLYVLDLPFMP